MPTATDLVTDLPADFEVFGQAVATSMADLLGGTTGQVLSKTTDADMDFTWVAANPGDITGVTAGVGITGGGTSGTVTVTNDMATTITAAGDIVVGTGSGTYDNLPIGTTNQILTADTTVSPYKVKWATPSASSSGLTLISTTTFSAVASQSFNSVFTSTYTNYLILGTGLFINTGSSDLRLRYRVSGTDSTAGAYIVGGFKSTNLALTNSALQTNYMAFGDIGTRDEGALQFTSMRPNLVKDCGGNYTYNGTNFNNPNNSGGGAVYSTATAFDGFTIYAGAGNLSGTISIYGMSI